MRAYLGLLLMCGSGFISPEDNAQDTVVVKHERYMTVYAASAHEPVMVSYTLKPEYISCDAPMKRTNNFKADPEIAGTALGKDYDGSGYDQGHLMSAQDNTCDEVAMNECFYYSNMLPQAPGLNRGIWKVLETDERDLVSTGKSGEMGADSIVVFCGGYGKDKTIGPDNVVVPKYCWKVIYIPGANGGEWDGYIFPNAKCDGTPDRYMDFTSAQMAWVKYCIRRFTGYKTFFK